MGNKTNEELAKGKKVGLKLDMWKMFPILNKPFFKMAHSEKYLKKKHILSFKLHHCDNIMGYSHMQTKNVTSF